MYGVRRGDVLQSRKRAAMPQQIVTGVRQRQFTPYSATMPNEFYGAKDPNSDNTLVFSSKDAFDRFTEQQQKRARPNPFKTAPATSEASIPKATREAQVQTAAAAAAAAAAPALQLQPRFPPWRAPAGPNPFAIPTERDGMLVYEPRIEPRAPEAPALPAPLPMDTPEDWLLNFGRLPGGPPAVPPRTYDRPPKRPEYVPPRPPGALVGAPVPLPVDTPEDWLLNFGRLPGRPVVPPRPAARLLDEVNAPRLNPQVRFDDTPERQGPQQQMRLPEPMVQRQDPDPAQGPQQGMIEAAEQMRALQEEADGPAEIHPGIPGQQQPPAMPELDYAVMPNEPDPAVAAGAADPTLNTLVPLPTGENQQLQFTDPNTDSGNADNSVAHMEAIDANVEAQQLQLRNSMQILNLVDENYEPNTLRRLQKAVQSARARANVFYPNQATNYLAEEHEIIEQGLQSTEENARVLQQRIADLNRAGVTFSRYELDYMEAYFQESKRIGEEAQQLMQANRVTNIAPGEERAFVALTHERIKNLMSRSLQNNQRGNYILQSLLSDATARVPINIAAASNAVEGILERADTAFSMSNQFITSLERLAPQAFRTTQSNRYARGQMVLVSPEASDRARAMLMQEWRDIKIRNTHPEGQNGAYAEQTVDVRRQLVYDELPQAPQVPLAQHGADIIAGVRPSNAAQLDSNPLLPMAASETIAQNQQYEAIKNAAEAEEYMLNVRAMEERVEFYLTLFRHKARILEDLSQSNYEALGRMVKDAEDVLQGLQQRIAATKANTAMWSKLKDYFSKITLDHAQTKANLEPQIVSKHADLAIAKFAALGLPVSQTTFVNFMRNSEMMHAVMVMLMEDQITTKRRELKDVGRAAPPRPEAQFEEHQRGSDTMGEYIEVQPLSDEPESFKAALASALAEQSAFSAGTGSGGTLAPMGAGPDVDASVIEAQNSTNFAPALGMPTVTTPSTSIPRNVDTMSNALASEAIASAPRNLVQNSQAPVVQRSNPTLDIPQQVLTEQGYNMWFYRKPKAPPGELTPYDYPEGILRDAYLRDATRRIAQTAEDNQAYGNRMADWQSDYPKMFREYGVPLSTLPAESRIYKKLGYKWEDVVKSTLQGNTPGFISQAEAESIRRAYTPAAAPPAAFAAAAPASPYVPPRTPAAAAPGTPAAAKIAAPVFATPLPPAAMNVGAVPASPLAVAVELNGQTSLGTPNAATMQLLPTPGGVKVTRNVRSDIEALRNALRMSYASNPDADVSTVIRSFVQSINSEDTLKTLYYILHGKPASATATLDGLKSVNIARLRANAMLEPDVNPIFEPGQAANSPKMDVEVRRSARTKTTAAATAPVAVQEGPVASADERDRQRLIEFIEDKFPDPKKAKQMIIQLALNEGAAKQGSWFKKLRDRAGLDRVSKIKQAIEKLIETGIEFSNNAPKVSGTNLTVYQYQDRNPI